MATDGPGHKCSHNRERRFIMEIVFMFLVFVVTPLLAGVVGIGYLVGGWALYSKYLGHLENILDGDVPSIAGQCLSGITWVVEHTPVLGMAVGIMGMFVGIVFYSLAWPIMLPLELLVKHRRARHDRFSAMLAL